jgi:hypothetical protein
MFSDTVEEEERTVSINVYQFDLIHFSSIIALRRLKCFSKYFYFITLSPFFSPMPIVGNQVGILVLRDHPPFYS